MGTTIYAIYHDVSFFLDEKFFSPATFVIVIGIIMLFVSLFGCVGALKESTCLVNIVSKPAQTLRVTGWDFGGLSII